MTDIDTIADQISELIPRILQGIQTSMSSVASVSLPQLVLLLGLKTAGPGTVTELAHARNVSPPTITRLVDRLLDAGLVKRVEDKADRRRVRIQMTPRGEQVVRGFQDAVRARWKSILALLPSAEQEAFLKAMRHVGEVLAETEKVGNLPPAVPVTHGESEP